MNSLIRQRFPGVEVVGSNYPPAASRVALAKLVNLGTFASLGLTHFGETICGALGVPTPELVANAMQNKMGSSAGAWFLGNTVSQNLLNTGAFEVFYDGEVIFSKLEQRRLPTIPEILDGLGDAIAAREGAGRSAEPTRTKRSPTRRRPRRSARIPPRSPRRRRRRVPGGEG